MLLFGSSLALARVNRASYLVQRVLKRFNVCVACRGFCSSASTNTSERIALPWIEKNRNAERLKHQQQRPSRKGRSVQSANPPKRSSWEDAADQYFDQPNSLVMGSENALKTVDTKHRRNEFPAEPSTEALADSTEEDADDEDDSEPVNDERWFRIKEKLRKMSAGDDREHGHIEADNKKRRTRNDDSRRSETDYRHEDGSEELDKQWRNQNPDFEEELDQDGKNPKPHFRESSDWRRDRTRKHQEEWGRRTWREVTASTIPKMVGEALYGVGPVLAALSIARREFYALYVQEGMDLSMKNKKKKDKDGIELVLHLARKLGVVIKEIPKHDLNMLVDNRPHQGLVLDASELELVGIKHLEPVEFQGFPPPLWLALDEVTDPQNFGAVVRSAYFFGAAGIVVCAKNSAPPTGVVSKASAGSLELVELRSCKNMMQFLVGSEKNGWRVLGAAAGSDSVPVSEVQTDVPTILVLGSEGRGLRSLVRQCCSQLVSVPGSDLPHVVPHPDLMSAGDDHSQVSEFNSFFKVESLNVSVATGILLYHLTASSKKSSLSAEIE